MIRFQTSVGRQFDIQICVVYHLDGYVKIVPFHKHASPHLCSDLKFIMEELDKAYNRNLKAAKGLYSADKLDGANSPTANDNMQSLWEISESHFKYPVVEQYLKTKRNSLNLIIKYLICRSLILVIVLTACIYLGYYISFFSLTDEFTCNIRTGILKNDTTIPSLVQCKLVAVGVFRLLSYINLIVYVMTMPFVMYSMLVPYRRNDNVLKVYEMLPTFSVQQDFSKSYDDLTLFLLFLEENVSELKSYKFLKVLENIKRTGENVDTMQLLTVLGTVKTDTVDGKRVNKCASEPTKGDTVDGKCVYKCASEPAEDEREKNEMELLVQPSSDGVTATDEKKVRQRLLDSSC
ncbi:hypothetical protein GDO86_004721 [Hymenochirus boettgeri]|uniref:Pannexin n=1 Tax=Hymenochirus boettgeri TaxID=247094 RepID=A0A8T2KF62_9PIPI|nr:hypothetical protein GDO86_004721 [Hymenochirus boettgeri]